MLTNLPKHSLLPADHTQGNGFINDVAPNVLTGAEFLSGAGLGRIAGGAIGALVGSGQDGDIKGAVIGGALGVLGGTKVPKGGSAVNVTNDIWNISPVTQPFKNSINVFDDAYRTKLADIEGQRVIKAMDGVIKKDKASSVTVMTHADGTVSVGISGQLDAKGTKERIGNLQKKLDKEYGKGKYQVGIATLDEKQGLMRVDPSDLSRGNSLGNCSEPKCATAAGKNASQITGFAALWRGAGPNPYPKNIDQKGLSLNQMDFCETCGLPHNQGIYSNEAMKGKRALKVPEVKKP
ncbi:MULTISPECIES: hypothetical protein [unclassified Acinetobacter]|uniref:hypothetical protein n=1 Tax=unclassified Acinetobacter TaxID=196816 RepID=UPI0035CFA82D